MLPLELSIMRTDVTHLLVSVRLRLQMGDATHTSYNMTPGIPGRIVRRIILPSVPCCCRCKGSFSASDFLPTTPVKEVAERSE